MSRIDNKTISKKHTSALFNVVNMVLEKNITNLEQIVKLRLIIPAASGAVNLLQSFPRRERHLVGCDADDGPILLVKLVNVDSPESLDFFPLEDQGGEFGHCRSWDFTQWRCEASNQVDGK